MSDSGPTNGATAPTSRPRLRARKALEFVNGDGRAKIQLPQDDRILSDCAAELGCALSCADVYNRNGVAFTIDRENRCLAPVTRASFRTMVEDHVLFFKVKRKGEREMVEAFQTMTEADAAGVLASPQFISRLRPIERVNPVRLPVKRTDGHIDLLPDGYDAESRTFTLEGGPVVTDIGTDLAKDLIDELLAEFPWADDGRSKAVTIGAMLTIFASGVLPRGALRPVFMHLANTEGSGKTLLTKLETVPVLGASPTSAKADDEDEMRKVLLTAVMESRPALLLDNFKGHLSSGVLEGFTSAQTWNGRILGVSKSFTGENTVTVLITGNQCTVSPDMRRRCLFVELFCEAERAEDRQFRQPIEVPQILERRQDILCALFSLVMDWHLAMEPKPSRGHASFPDWARTIGGIVEHAGYHCPLETPQIAAATDEAGRDMRALVMELSQIKGPVSFADVVALSQEKGLFPWAVPDGEVTPKHRSAIGKLLSRYDRRLFAGYRFRVDGKGHHRRYRAEPAQQGQQGQQGLSPILENEPFLVQGETPCRPCRPCREDADLLRDAEPACWPD